jgi:hypothetical protein
MSAPGNSNAPDSRPRDSRLESFLRQAGPILATERGLSDASRLKLRALAEELHLPPALFEQALVELGREGARSSLTRSEREFVRFIDKELQGLPRSILTEKVEQKAIDIAADRFQLKPPRARELIRAQADALGIERVSRTDAEHYIEQLCQSICGPRGKTPDEHRQRIVEAARSWGLTSEDVDALIQRARQQQRRRRSQQMLAPTVWSLAITLGVVALAGGALWWYATRAKTPRTVETSPPPAAPEPAFQLEQPGWWSGELYQAASRAAVTSPAWRERLTALTASQVERRRTAFESLVSDPARTVPAALPISLLADLLASEPDGVLLNELVGRLIDGSQPLAEVPTVKDWQLARQRRALLRELAHRVSRIGSDPARAADAGQAIAALQAIASQPPSSDEELLAEQFLSATSAAAPGNAQAAAHFLASADFPPASARSPAMCETMLSILDSDPSVWTTLKPLIERQLRSGNRSDWLPWVAWIDPAKNRELARWLAVEIAAVLRISLDPTDAPRARAAIQAALAPPSPLLAARAQRQAALSERIESLRGKRRSAESDPQAIAHEAYLATLAFCGWCGGVSGTGDFERFDRLLSRGPRTLQPPTAKVDSSRLLLRQVSKTASAVERDALAAAVKRLADGQLSHSARLQSIRRIAEIADRFPDVEYHDARIIAGSMLALYDSDVLEIETAWFAMRHWPNLLLATLDAPETWNLPVDKVLSSFNVLLRNEISLSGRRPWPSDVRREVLGSLINGLEASIQSTEAGAASEWSQLESYFFELQRERAEVLQESIGGPELDPSWSAAEIQSWMIRRLSEHLSLDPQSRSAIERRATLAAGQSDTLVRCLLLEHEMLSVAVATSSTAISPLNSRPAMANLAEQFRRVESAIADRYAELFSR